MTISEITPSALIGLSHIDLTPIWASQAGDLEDKEDVIILYDMYLKDGTWIGSKRLLKHCEEVNDNVRRNGSNRERL